jgi:hypothetical protein
MSLSDRAEYQHPAAASSHGQPNSESFRVKVVNHVRNGPQSIRRRAAEHYVSEGRAIWIEGGMVRLVESHPKNQAAAAAATAWQGDPTSPDHGWRVLNSAPRALVVQGIRSFERAPLKWAPPLHIER